MFRPQPLLTPSGEPARTDWTLDDAVRHLNHGSFGAVPVLAQNRQQVYRTAMDTNPCDWFMNIVPAVERARTEVSAFLRSDPQATALVPNASAGVSIVYANIPGWRGMKIVTTDHTYGAVMMGAERLARRWEGTVVAVHIPLDATEAEAFDLIAAEMTEGTGLVVIDHVTSATARELPAARIAAEGRRLGIPVLVDAAHSPGMIAEPLASIDADFWVGNLHKFACAPRGTGAIVARGTLTQQLFPLIDSWGAPEPFPNRFDQQGTLDVTSYLAAAESFDVIENHYGWDAARVYFSQLGDYAENIISYALSAASGSDCTVDVGMPVAALRLIRLPDGLATTTEDAHSLRAQLAGELGIETAITSWGGSGFLRLSTHVYNTAEDYEDFVDRAVPFIVERAGVHHLSHEK